MKQLLLIFTTFIVGNACYSQGSSYQMSTFQRAYTELEFDFDLTNRQVWDDPEYSVSLPFDFQFFDTLCRVVNIDDSGLYLTLRDHPNNFGGITFLEDLIDRGYFEGESVSKISFDEVGEPGNRIFKVQWKNAGFYTAISDGIDNDFLNFQVWLYEVDNSFEIHFGNNFILDKDLSLGGRAGVGPVIYYDDNLNDEFIDNICLIAGNSSNPDFFKFDRILEDDLDILLNNKSLTNEPNSGQVYRFEMNTSSVDSEILPQSTFKIAPNPVSETFRIENIDLLQIDNISLINSNGQKVINLKPDFNQTINTLNIGHLPIGIYTVLVQTSHGVWSQRIVKN